MGERLMSTPPTVCGAIRHHKGRPEICVLPPGHGPFDHVWNDYEAYHRSISSFYEKVDAAHGKPDPFEEEERARQKARSDADVRAARRRASQDEHGALSGSLGRAADGEKRWKDTHRQAPDAWRPPDDEDRTASPSSQIVPDGVEGVSVGSEPGRRKDPVPEYGVDVPACADVKRGATGGWEICDRRPGHLMHGIDHNYVPSEEMLQRRRQAEREGNE